MERSAVFTIRGMQRDLSKALFSAEFAYENYNIRLSNNGDNSLLAITMEEGTVPVDNITIYGNIIGYAILNDSLVLFNTYRLKPKDSIIVIKKENNTFVKNTLYSGNLNFSKDHLIETLPLYENEKVQKIYWTDGLNQPRVINIVADENERGTWTDTSFDFLKEESFRLNVNVSKQLSGGIFPSGVIQYVITCFNQNGSESPILYISPLMYLTSDDKGEAGDTSVSCSFKLFIQLLDKTSYEYLRVYSIIRTSLDAVPTVSIVRDVKFSDFKYPEYENFTEIIDTNIGNATVDPTELFYKGGTKIKAETLAAKDGTLFLGGITLDSNYNEAYNALTEFVNKQTKNFEIASTSRDYTKSNKDSSWYEFAFSLNQTSKSGSEASYPVKHLMFKESYRLGFRVKFENNEWSDPIFLSDYTMKAYQDSTTFRYPSLDITSWKSELDKYNIKAVMPVIVFPDESNREVVCQGIACPTVYNIKDRINNSPFVQSSWFFRPCKMFNDSNNQYRNSIEKTITEIRPFTSVNILTNIFQRLDQGQYKMKDGYKYEITSKELPYVSYNESVTDTNTKILNNANTSIFDISSDDLKAGLKSLYNNYENLLYYVDPSILTINSPEVDYNEQPPVFDSNCKIRTVGFAVIDSNYVEMQVSDKINSITSKPVSSISRVINTTIAYGQGGLRAISPFNKVWKNDTVIGAFGTYSAAQVLPWDYNYAKNWRSSLLWSKETYYNSYERTVAEGEIGVIPLASIKVFNSEEVTALTLDRRKGERNPLIYYGNVDKLLNSPNRKAFGMSTNYNSTPELCLTNIRDYTTEDPLVYYTELWIQYDNAVSMKYKSNKHIVAVLENSLYNNSEYVYSAYPSVVDNNSFIGDELTKIFNTNQKFFWDGELENTADRTIHGFMLAGSTYIDNGKLVGISNNNNNFCLPIVDIIRTVDNKFGDSSLATLKTQTWLQAGPICYTNSGLEHVYLKFIYGDTFYQRYDCLKTYPFGSEDINSVSEVASVMIETRVNLDGRTDNNRGRLTFFGLTPDTFSQINPVYNQNNNFFTYRVINDDSMVTNFPNTITWSKTKTLGEKIDTWTNITMASTLDLDGDKGKLRALKKWNNEIIAFQDKGISNILYNSRTQLAGTDGVPIELANSGKVDGKRYLSNIIGCNNKWSIRETPKGLYFIDGYNKGIYLFNGQFNNLSDSLGFNSWASDILSDPDNNNFFTCYDNSVQDVLFINDNLCLAFNETLNQFTSFYQYEGTKWLFNFNGDNLAINLKDLEALDIETIYKLRQTSSSKFFYKTSRPSYVSLVVNEHPLNDKIFTGLDYRGVGWELNEEGNKIETNPFRWIQVENDYQIGKNQLRDKFGYPSNLKRKFRIWRNHIPRDNSNNLDRIRSPWARITLYTGEPDLYNDLVGIEVNDIVVKYFE